MFVFVRWGRDTCSSCTCCLHWTPFVLQMEPKGKPTNMPPTTTTSFPLPLPLFPASSSQSRGTQTRGEDVTNSESLKPDNLSATVLYYFIACMQNNLMASACVALCLAPHMRSKSAPPPSLSSSSSSGCYFHLCSFQGRFFFFSNSVVSGSYTACPSQIHSLLDKRPQPFPKRGYRFTQPRMLQG